MPDTMADVRLGGGPKYAALADALRGRIDDGSLTEGARLPPVRELAHRIGVTPGTVSRAYAILTDEGRLVARVGRGTFVARQTAVAPPYAVEGPQPDVVNLKSSIVPDVGQAAEIAEAMRRSADALDSGVVVYGTRHDDLPVIEALLRHLAPADYADVAPEDVVLTAGGQHALTTAMQYLIRGARRTVLTEELCYPGFRFGASMIHARTASVRGDADGILPDALDAACRQHGPSVLCLLPVISNPTLVRTPPERRAALVEVARRHDLHILADDTFSLGQDGGPSFRALMPDRGWQAVSLSKSLSPVLRFGALIAPRGHGPDALAVTQQQFYGLSGLTLATVRDLLESGAADRIREDVGRTIARRAGIAAEILGPCARTDPAMPFAWLTLPPTWRASSFAEACLARGLLIRPGDQFAAPGEAAPNAVRVYLNGRLDEPAFRAALGTVAALLDRPPIAIEA